MSSPSHSPESYGDTLNNFYDAEFAAEINTKMRVPNQIKLIPNNNVAHNNTTDVDEDPAIIAVKKVNDNAEWMRVPERICVVGGEGHLTTREPPPELKLENTFIGKQELVQLNTPPRTLRIEDTVPVFETPLKQLDKALKTVENRTLNKSMLGLNDSLMDFEESELNSQNYLHLRRRLLQINQRLDSLEIENNRRNKRDFLLYSIGFLYILFRGINWFSSSGNQFRF